MKKQLKDIIDSWYESAEKFDGDLALFWAGRMSMAAGMVLKSKPGSLTDTCKILDLARTEYDRIIFERA